VALREAAEVVAEQELYPEQKRIDDALDIYQEALEFWNLGEPDKAIQSLDQSYELISSIQNETDPEIRQQKEDLRLLISKRILEIYASRSHPQVGHNGQIPLAMNDYVTREIKRFQTSERQFFIQAYRLSGKYRPYIVEQIRKAGLPEELSWLPLIESGFKPKAFSKARALGPWQFIASTGYRFDLRRDRWVDERMDLERSTQAAIDYLQVLHDLFGDWTTALAAYNCGEGNVLRVIRQQHVNYLDDFWDLYPRLPLETARYVPRFLAALHIISAPENYGFQDLELDQPLTKEKVQINRQMRLTDIARALDVPAQTLEELNPSLRYKATPDYVFTLNVPEDRKEEFLAKLEKIPLWKPPKRAYVVHRVRYGETLSGIAMKYKVPVRHIVRANRLRSASRIRAGQRLRIPLRGNVLVTTAKTYPKGSKLQYRVRRGDSLWLIAKRFNTSVASIKALNDIHSDLLQSGQLITIKTGVR
jgi:membrane-bound lytic murein transglycosylase D